MSIMEWPYDDAIQDDPLTEMRIPVLNTHVPDRGFLGGFLKEWTEEESFIHKGYPFRSSERPTETEAKMLVSFIEEEKRNFAFWYLEEMNGWPLDHSDYNNGCMFIKYGTDDWGVRRLSWSEGHAFIPGPRHIMEKYPEFKPSGPFTLEQAMDYKHQRSSERVPANWAQWKAEHPEIFSGS